MAFEVTDTIEQILRLRPNCVIKDDGLYTARGMRINYPELYLKQIKAKPYTKEDLGDWLGKGLNGKFGYTRVFFDEHGEIDWKFYTVDEYMKLKD